MLESKQVNEAMAIITRRTSLIEVTRLLNKLADFDPVVWIQLQPARYRIAIGDPDIPRILALYSHDGIFIPNSNNM